MNLRSISTDKAKLQQNLNSITNDNTSAFTHSSKKYFSPSCIGNKNYTEDLSKFRMGLLSAGSTSNNNIIIPMIPIRRPVSNFNFGGGQLWNNFENNNKNIINKINAIDEDKNKNNNQINQKEDSIIFNPDFNNEKGVNNINNININDSKKNFNIYTKFNNGTRNKLLKSQDIKNQYNAFPLKSDINNLYLGMDKMINKLHKIKIEKGMMNTGIMNSLNKKFNNDYQNQIKLFKKSQLSIMFNKQSDNMISKTVNLNNFNSEKNKSTRSHSFNNKNNFL